jgi:hypothetical protein
MIVRTRIYGTDPATGRRVLLHRPGDVIDDQEAKRVADLGEGRDKDRHETPPKSLRRMTLAELRKVCDEEGIDPGDAIVRADYVKAIEAGRAAAGEPEQ